MPGKPPKDRSGFYFFKNYRINESQGAENDGVDNIKLIFHTASKGLG